MIRAAGPALALIAAVGAAAGVSGQEARLLMDIDTTVIHVGDPVTVRLWVDHPADWSVAWPDTLEIAPFEVLSSGVSDPVLAGEGARSRAEYVVTSFELGDLEIPSVSIEVRSGDGASESVTTDPFRIRVESVGLDGSGDIRDIKGPLAIARSWWNVVLLALGVLLAAAMAAYAARRWRRRPEAEPPAPSVPTRPFHELAYEALDELGASSMLERGQVKAYHVRISEIIRTYVEGQLRVPALELTTSEVAEGLERAALDDELVGDFRAFLDRCDLVKFAKMRPADPESIALLGDARSLVDRTSGWADRDADRFDGEEGPADSGAQPAVVTADMGAAQGEPVVGDVGGEP